MLTLRFNVLDSTTTDNNKIPSFYIYIYIYILLSFIFLPSPRTFVYALVQ